MMVVGFMFEVHVLACVYIVIGKKIGYDDGEIGGWI